jgi:HK97 family phage portal protein
MGILERLGFGRRSWPAQALNFASWFQPVGEVAERRALGQSSVWSAVNLIVGDLSSLPLNVFDRTSDGGRQRVDLSAKAYLPWVLRFQPNPYQTAPVFLGVVTYDLLLKGSAYVFKAKNSVGEVVQLHRIAPEMVTVEWDGKRKFFRFDGTVLTTEELIHVIGLTSDGLRGMSLLEVCNRTLAGAVGVEEFAATYFKNGSTPAGVLSTDDKIGKDAQKQAKADWEGLYSGPSNQHKIAVLAGAWKFQPVSSPAKDAQLIEARGFTVGDIARIFRIPPYKLGDTTKVSYSSIEAQQIEYWQSCLRPMAVRIEAAFNAGLIATGQQATRYVEFDYTSIVKPDSAAMTDLLDKQVKAGLITLNEARAKLNYNRVDGGDFLLIPQNQAKLEGGQVEPINQIQAPGGTA